VRAVTEVEPFSGVTRGLEREGAGDDGHGFEGLQGFVWSCFSADGSDDVSLRWKFEQDAEGLCLPSDGPGSGGAGDGIAGLKSKCTNEIDLIRVRGTR
jgi:hypothetical protein